MSIGNCESIDLNNSTRLNTTHESNDISLSSFNSNNINNTSKISNTGLSSEQGVNTTTKTLNGENMNKEMIEKRKRELNLNLNLKISNGDQNNLNTTTSSDSINGSNSNSMEFAFNNDNEPNLKRHKPAAYFGNGSLQNFPLPITSLTKETPSNNEIIQFLDKNNTLTTPQVERLLMNELNASSIKTPGSAISILKDITLFPADIFTPNPTNSETSITPCSTINPSVIFTTLTPQAGPTTTAAAQAAAVVIAPSIPGSTLTNNANNYAMLTNVSNTINNTNTGNFLIFQNDTHESTTDKIQSRQDYKNVSYGDNILVNKLTSIKEDKDNYLQTVPVHPTNLVNNRTLTNNTTTTNNNSNNRISQPQQQTQTNKSRGKTTTKQTKSASINKSSDSFNGSSTPNSSTFNSRRDTGNSTTSSSSNLDTSFSPINLDKQESLKLEKKRERNREAARKCRTRKLEKIASLEIQVKKLTETNEMEKAKTDKLREEINIIRMKLEQHKRIHNCDLKLTI